MTKFMKSGRMIDMGLVDQIGESTVVLAGNRFTYDQGIIRGGNLVLDVAEGISLIHSLYWPYMERSGAYAYHNAGTAPQNVNMPGMLIPRQYFLYEENKASKPKKIKRASLSHQQWIVPAVLSDRRQVSMRVYPAHVLLYELYPDLYTKRISQRDPDEFGELLSKFGVGVPRQTAKYWIQCSQTLFGEFEGNPSLLFNHCGWSVSGIEQFKSEGKKKEGTDPLPGFGPKISSLCFMFFTELELCKMPDDAFPVDMHVQRLFIQYGALTKIGSAGNEIMEMLLRPFNCEVARKYELDKLNQSHSMWQLGRSSCTECYRKRGNEILCPIAKECMGNVNAHKYFKEGLWPEKDDVMRKGFDRKLRIPPGPLFEQ